MMLATCLATVAGLMTSSLAMSLLLRPSAISAAISRSRGVSELGGRAAVSLPAALPAATAGDGFSASSMAASVDRARPRAHSRATPRSPSRRAAAR